MDNIDFKDIKVSASALDIKSNVGKTLSEILTQLQSGAQMIATVVKKSISGETVLNTVHGRMITDNKFNLVRGDVVNIKLTDVSDNISGEVVSINNQTIDQDSSIKMQLFSQLLPVQSEVTELLSLFPIDKQNLSYVPDEIKGVISYLNLSKMDKTDVLYQILDEAQITRSKNIPVTVKVVTNSISHIKDSFIGIVSGGDKNANQLIKTEFGVITTENTQMHIGQKLILTVTYLNDKPIASSFIQNITEFIENISDNMGSFDEIMRTVNISHHLNRRRQNHSHNDFEISNSSETDTDDKAVKLETLTNNIQNKAEQKLQFNHLIELMKNDEIKKIINEYTEIKKLLSDEDQAFDTDWQTVFIPIYINNNPEKQKIKIKRNGAQHLQFIIDIKFTQNPMQIDGNVVFQGSNKKPKSFDMVLKSEKELDGDLKKHITDIFAINQNITGISGSLVIVNSSNG